MKAGHDLPDPLFKFELALIEPVQILTFAGLAAGRTVPEPMEPRLDPGLIPKVMDSGP
jgi:hypothetical protein